MLKQVTYKQAQELYALGLREIAVHSENLEGAFRYAEKEHWEPFWLDVRNGFSRVSSWFYVIATE